MLHRLDDTADHKSFMNHLHPSAVELVGGAAGPARPWHGAPVDIAASHCGIGVAQLELECAVAAEAAAGGRLEAVALVISCASNFPAVALVLSCARNHGSGCA